MLKPSPANCAHGPQNLEGGPVASIALQVSVDDCPNVIDVGDAVSTTPGANGL